MAVVLTPNYSFKKPNVGEEIDIWGPELNANWDSVDTLIKALYVAMGLTAPLASPALTGTPTAPTGAPGLNTTQLATTAFVEAARVILAAVDATKAPLASPALTGNPTSPTPTPGDNDTSIATTAFVTAAVAAGVGSDPLKANLASPSFTGNPLAPTPTPGDNDTSIATTAFVAAAIAAAASGVPSGSMFDFAGAAAPTGYLLCDGASVLRATYASLFTAIGTTWGSADGTHFNVPDFRGRVGVGAGTGSITETQAAANFNTSDVITVTSNVMSVKPKWLTGMPVVVTTDGVLPTGIAAATTYYVRRLSATTISLYATLAQAMVEQSTNGRVNITAIGSGNHTLTCTLQARALADLFGVEMSNDVPMHYHAGGAGVTAGNARVDAGTLSNTNTTGDPDGITNMPPSIVVTKIIKT